LVYYNAGLPIKKGTIVRISFLILNYNRASFLDRAIRSCLNQYIFGFEREIIVVDDSSSDNSLEILAKYGDSIKVLTNTKNMGVGYGSKLALESSTGDYFIRVDSDDYLSPISSAVLFTALQANPQYSFAYADHYRVDKNENKIELVELSDQEKLLNHGAGVLFKTKDVISHGGYNEKLRHAEDTELLMKLIKNGCRGVHIPIPLYRYYIHGENLSDSPKQDKAQQQIRSDYGF